MRVRHSILLGVWLLVLAAWPSVPAGSDQPEEPASAPVDEKTAEGYNRFRDEAARRIVSGVDQMSKRYGLREDQVEKARDLASDFTEQFLRDNGPKMFDLMQRAQAVQRYMHEAGTGWQDIPPDIRQDLGDRMLPLIQSLQKQMDGFAERLNESLDPQQQEMLAGDRRRLQRGLWLARVQASVMAGRPPPEAPAGLEASPAGEGPGGPRPGPASMPAPVLRLDAWELYVRRFVERYRLDEVQKLQAMDLLAEYKAKAEQVARGMQTSQPALDAARQGPAASTMPAGGTLGDFNQRLVRLRQQRQPIQAVFEELKVELDKIPTPVQRDLAEQDRPAPAPEGPPAPRPEENR